MTPLPPQPPAPPAPAPPGPIPGPPPAPGEPSPTPPSPPRPIDAFDRIVAADDTAMVVVTAAADGERAGCLVGFHCQVSIEPRRYGVWLSRANHTYRVAAKGRSLAVHALRAGDHDLAALFGGETGDEHDKLADCDWSAGPDGVPLLDRCPDRFVLHHDGPVDLGGDHVLFIGEPQAATFTGSFAPLRLSAVNDVEAGHPETA